MREDPRALASMRFIKRPEEIRAAIDRRLEELKKVGLEASSDAGLLRFVRKHIDDLNPTTTTRDPDWGDADAPASELTLDELLLFFRERV